MGSSEFPQRNVSARRSSNKEQLSLQMGWTFDGMANEAILEKLQQIIEEGEVTKEFEIHASKIRM